MLSTTKNTAIEFHPAADIFPLMEGEEFDALVADIKKNGLRDGLMLYEGKILDGRNRYLALRALGHDAEHIKEQHCPEGKGTEWMRGWTPVAYAISANIHRRHLTPELKRDLILRFADWTKSDRQIAADMKTNKNTVGRLRKKAEATVPVGTVDAKRVGKDGKARKQPAKKPRRSRDELALERLFDFTTKLEFHCGVAPELEVPPLPAEECKEARSQIKEAVAALLALEKRIAAAEAAS